MKLLRWTQANVLLVVPVLVAILFYSWQAALGFWTFDRPRLVWHLAGVILLSVIMFAAAYRLAPISWVAKIGARRLDQNHLNIICLSGVAAYALLLAISILTADNVAFFAAFAGCSADDLAEFRETFLRTRDGLGQGLNYLYVIFNNAIMPLAVAYAFWARKKWRFLALAVFIFGLSLTLQKGNIISAGLPLMALYLISARSLSDLLKALPAGAMIVTAVVIMYFLAGGYGPKLYQPELSCHEASEAARAEKRESRAETEASPDQGARSVSQVPEKYNITGSDNQFALVINRMVWIPYVTAIDWLRYQEDVLDGRLVLGRSIKPLAIITGQEPLNLEREVARMQWGQNEQGTASSNAIYAVDAWVNFGVLGVVLYAAIFGFAAKLISSTHLPPLVAAAVVPVYTAGFVGLPPVMLSGGLAAILLLAIVVKPTQEVA